MPLVLLTLFWQPDSAAGEVVALYQYREAERIEGPAVVGESVLLQVRRRRAWPARTPRSRAAAAAGRGLLASNAGSQAAPAGSTAPLLTALLPCPQPDSLCTRLGYCSATAQLLAA